MFHHEIDIEMERLVFTFFYKFSRFEYSLKANSFCEAKGRTCRAEAGWIAFRERYEIDYALSDAATGLLQNPPKLQVYKNRKLSFEDEQYTQSETDLLKVIRAIKRIRNNLFHGGKHGACDEVSLRRNTYLLSTGCTILDELSAIDPNVEFDYPGRY